MKSFFNKFHDAIWIFKYLSPTYYIEVLDEYINEFSNFLFFKKKLKSAERDGILDRNDMNVSKSYDKFYFAINLNPEYLLLPKDDLVSHERMILSNEIIKIENSFSKYNLFDLLKFKYERILDDDFYAYGVSCSFHFRKINKFNNRYIIIYTGIIITTISYLLLF